MLRKSTYIWPEKIQLLAKELHNEISLNNYNWHEFRGNKQRRSAELIISAISQLINDGDDTEIEDLLNQAILWIKEEIKDMNPKVAKEFINIYQMRKHEIALSRSESVAKISEAFLKDFDWSLRVVMGSSDLSTTRKAILLLTLSLENPNGDVVNKTYEMDLDSLNDLLKKFDRVANATQKLRIA